MAFNASRVRLHQVNAAFASEITDGALVLDAGAGRAPYAQLFSHARYETADFELVDKEYAKQTYTCDLADIPVEDARFDAIVCNQVLEHLPRPADVLREFWRVLRPGGRIILTAPLFYAEHEQPYDFYRYTQFGHHHLFQEAGFEIDSIERLEGYYGTLAYQLNTAGRVLPLRIRTGRARDRMAGMAIALMFRPLFTILSRLLQHLEVRLKVDVAYPKNYVVLARKPLEPASSPQMPSSSVSNAA